jgi:hypothetical protein
MTCVLRLRGSYGPQLQTLALNKKTKKAQSIALCAFSEN